MKKWMALIGFNCLLIAACAGQDTPSDRSTLAADDPTDQAEAAIKCPLNCNDSGCRLANGTCTIACNACLCKRRGGTPDNSCLFDADVVDDRGLDSDR